LAPRPSLYPACFSFHRHHRSVFTDSPRAAANADADIPSASCSATSSAQSPLLRRLRITPTSVRAVIPRAQRSLTAPTPHPPCGAARMLTGGLVWVAALAPVPARPPGYAGQLGCLRHLVPSARRGSSDAYLPCRPGGRRHAGAATPQPGPRDDLGLARAAAHSSQPEAVRAPA